MASNIVRHLFKVTGLQQGLPRLNGSLYKPLQGKLKIHLCYCQPKRLNNSFNWGSYRYTDLKCGGVNNNGYFHRGSIQPFKYRGFHTTPPRLLHPLVWVVLRPVAKVAAMIFGRSFRKWWSSLPADKKALFLDFLERNKFPFLISIGVLGFSATAYYETHLEETPMTGRKRFIIFSENQFEKITEMQFQMLLAGLEDKIVKTDHPMYPYVVGIANRLLQSNGDLQQIFKKTWSVSVVDSPEQNAFVLPNGRIFVYTGMLAVCNTNDELGVILGHEMAHAILGHAAEQVSHAHMTDLFLIAVVALIWALVPSDVIALLVQWLSHKVTSLLLELPYSRKLESEADDIGLNMAAKACFDIRASSAFWAKMNAMEEMKGNPQVEWLSTHPTHETRAATLDKRIPDALELRASCKCPPLSKVDPRSEIQVFLKRLEAVKPGQRLAIPLTLPKQAV